MKDITYNFECVIAMLAPVCATCGTQFIGHGMESGENFTVVPVVFVKTELQL